MADFLPDYSVMTINGRHRPLFRLFADSGWKYVRKEGVPVECDTVSQAIEAAKECVNSQQPEGFRLAYPLPAGTDRGRAMTDRDLIAAAQKLMDAVTFDVSGIDGRGGNGGLTSTETVRACDELRLTINKYRTAKRAEGQSE